MKKTYTKRQITEAISYWKKQLKMMNESEFEEPTVNPDISEYAIIPGVFSQFIPQYSTDGGRTWEDCLDVTRADLQTLNSAKRVLQGCKAKMGSDVKFQIIKKTFYPKTNVVYSV